jgi:hypothetical protein
MQHKTQITLSVNITYDVVSPFKFEKGDAPDVIDITGVYIDGARTTRGRKVNLLHSLSESELSLLEDSILDNVEE